MKYKFTDEHREKLRQAHLGVKLSAQHRLGVIKTLKPIKKGQTYEEAFGPEIAKAMKEKMRLAKLGKKMPWNKGFKLEKHPRWIKDRSKLKKKQERNDSAYHDWRRCVWIRDSYKCRLKDETCSGKIISHHILRWQDYPDLRYDVNNGITLCHAHHPRKRGDEKRLESVFKSLIELQT